MKTLLILALTIASFTLFVNNCGAQKLLSSSEREYYSTLLSERRARFPELESGVFSTMDKATLWDEKEALLFLFATSPLSDLTANSGDFFLSNVRTTLESSRRVNWGKDIPSGIFMHFVLPLRVNNEALDSSRLLFSHILRRRVEGLSMREAVLEINHWCHEHVTYEPSDARTRSPLETIRNAKGRCGEESTLTTAAMRAAGIPARQVYVPRWAHADDNHAWVEVWVDGVWHFIGACEPDVDLDRAWFTEPARRAMLTASTVQGRYTGEEDILKLNSRTTRINTLPVYADTHVLPVLIHDPAGQPMAGVRVDFCVYNYAEFYPLASLYTDENGIASMRTGFGDLLIWAHIGDRYVFEHVARDAQDTLRLVLGEQTQHFERIVMDYIPPPESPLSLPEAANAYETKLRNQADDSLRALHEAQFIDSTQTTEFAERLGYPADSCWVLLRQSRGNWPDITSFLAAASTFNKVPAMAFLHTLAKKDLQDAHGDVLLAHYREAFAAVPAGYQIDDSFLRYVCCPRIGLEELRSWRGKLQQTLRESPSLADCDAESIARWIRDSISVVTNENWSRVPLIPTEVMSLRAGDEYSRRILFVALCRSAGIPARLDPASGIPQFLSDDIWRGTALGVEPALPQRSAELLLTIPEHQHIQEPNYAQHFSLARFESGTFHTLDYEGDARFGSWPVRLELVPGRYLLTNGNRQPDGSVFVTMEFFTLGESDRVEHEIHIRDDDDPPVVQGVVDPSLLPRSDARSFVLLWIERGTEPVSHALLDIAAEREALGAEPALIFLAGSGGMDKAELSGIAREFLPENTMVSDDGADALRAGLIAGLRIPEGMKLPLIAICDAEGNITFHTRGYTIGVGAQILHVLQRMKLEK